MSWFSPKIARTSITPPTTNPTPNASSVLCHHDPVTATRADKHRQRMPTAITTKPAAKTSRRLAYPASRHRKFLSTYHRLTLVAGIVRRRRRGWHVQCSCPVAILELRASPHRCAAARTLPADPGVDQRTRGVTRRTPVLSVRAQMQVTGPARSVSALDPLQHYNTGRPHRALGQLTPAQADACPPEPINLADHLVRRKQVLGDSPTSTTSPLYQPALLRKSRSPPESYFRPDEVLRKRRVYGGGDQGTRRESL
jgi:hypothetical protein